MLKIEIDEGSGFCFGVTTAIKKAEEELANGSNLYCLGLINGLRNAMPAWIDLINNSFLSDEMKQSYLDLISRRMDVLTKS